MPLPPGSNPQTDDDEEEQGTSASDSMSTLRTGGSTAPVSRWDFASTKTGTAAPATDIMSSLRTGNTSSSQQRTVTPGLSAPGGGVSRWGFAANTGSVQDPNLANFLSDNAMASGKEQGEIASGTGTDPDSWKDEWQQLWEMYNQGGDAAMQQTYMDEARAGRGMANMNAMTSGSMGGAFAGGAGRVAVGGMQARLQAQQQHLQQGLELRMSYLDRLYSDAEREDNQEMMQWIESERNKTALDVAAIQAGGEADLLDAQKEANKQDLLDVAKNDPDMLSNTDKVEYAGYQLADKYGISEEEAKAASQEFMDYIKDLMKQAAKGGPASAAAKKLKKYDGEDGIFLWYEDTYGG